MRAYLATVVFASGLIMLWAAIIGIETAGAGVIPWYSW